MANEKKPRHYADKIMKLAPEQRATELSLVPMHFKSVVADYVRIAEVFEAHEIENLARTIANEKVRVRRQAVLSNVEPVLRDRVKTRAVELFNKLKEAKCE